MDIKRDIELAYNQLDNVTTRIQNFAQEKFGLGQDTMLLLRDMYVGLNAARNVADDVLDRANSIIKNLDLDASSKELLKIK